MTDSLYTEYRLEMNKIADVRYASALLQWDQETYLPIKGAAFRGQQIATLSEIAHRSFTSEKLGALLQEILSKDILQGKEKRNVEVTWEDYSRQKKFTPEFVREMSETVSRSFHSWVEARKANSFSLFATDLARVIDLKKIEADLLGYTDHPYNALLNEHDKGSTVQLLDQSFDQVRSPLKSILDRILEQPQVRDEFLFQFFPKDKQWEFGMLLLKDLGYDFEAGRQDISEHPFTINFNSRDVRITTRINENDLSSMVWSCIHELGHALYEQGLPEDDYGLPGGEAVSYSIHESQSRLWENHIGRSLAFCEKWMPVLREFFPAQLGQISVEDFYRGINKVQPSAVRTEADEVTYHFHVIIRYELEKKLLEGELKTEDIPWYWNEQYFKYLGIKILDDKQGCLQDVHWSHGSFGYFPTYSMGSFYAAQMFDQASRELPALDEKIRAGNSRPILNWLATKIYPNGRTMTSEELCSMVSGKPLDIHFFLNYIVVKYRNIYNF